MLPKPRAAHGGAGQRRTPHQLFCEHRRDERAVLQSEPDARKLTIGRTLHGRGLHRFQRARPLGYIRPVVSQRQRTRPHSLGRFGIDIFIKRFSVGVAGGVTDKDVGILAPRIGYLFGLMPTIGLWLRGGAFYAATPGPNYVGVTAEALLQWFAYPLFAFHFGPTLDVAFADKQNLNYVAIGMPVRPDRLVLNAQARSIRRSLPDFFRAAPVHRPSRPAQSSAPQAWDPAARARRIDRATVRARACRPSIRARSAAESSVRS